MRLRKLIVLAALAAVCLAPGALANEVTKLVLIDASRNVGVGELYDGRTVNLAETGGALNIRADVDGAVQSVRFVLDGKSGKTESVKPFASHGDTNGNYNSWRPTKGDHKIEVTPFTETGTKGASGEPFIVSFIVVGAPKPVPSKSAYADIASDDEMLPIPAPARTTTASISGDFRQWHKVTVDFEGPNTSVTARPNPFLHYRLNVTFSQGALSYVVPGYYAGDGQGGGEGNVWRAHFMPPTTGTWKFQASFRAGYNVNVSTDPNAGAPTACDGAKGGVQVEPSNKSGADFRAAEKGLLRNAGHHYLTFAGSGKPWVKGGPDIPENLLGYDGFINTPKARHSFAPHEKDWKPGDPDWDGGKGKRIIGAFNFIAEQGGNCVYFLPMNIGGDGKDTFPTIGEFEKTRYDNAKMDQWETVFAHAQQLGIFLHFQLAETESQNENYHDGGELGPERKLFYRQMIARFGHHPGLEYDLGEENDYGSARHKAFAASLKSFDPYDHPIAIHTHGGKFDPVYGPQLGNPDIDMTAFQGGNSWMSMGNLIVEWRNRSAAAGVKLAVSYDEPQPIENDIQDLEKGYDFGRRAKMWPLYMSGGAGFEWYVQEDGRGHSLDHRLEDYREMLPALNWAGIATAFMESLPLLEMAPDHALGAKTADGNTYVLAKPGEVYALYNDETGKGLQLDLSGAEGKFTVQWLNPRDGGGLQAGSKKTVQGGGVRSLGAAPDSLDRDWVCLVTAAE